MRSELVEIENIERYLEGKMSGSELNAFEAKMNADPAFQQEVINQGIVVDRVNNMGKMEALNVAHTNHVRRAAVKSWAIKGIIGATAVTAAIAGGKALADMSEGSSSNGEELVVGVDHNEDGTQNGIGEDTKMYEDAIGGVNGQNGNNSGSNSNMILADQEDTSKKDTAKTKEKAEANNGSGSGNGNGPGTGKGTGAGDGSGNGKKKDEVKKETSSSSSKNKDAFRIEGTKMYLVSDDARAKIHFEREISIYDTWSFVDSESDAQYKIKLRYKKQALDRLSWIEIYDIKTDERVFRSLQSRGLNGGMRTVNLKQASIEQLVHEILAHEFFGME